MSDADYVVTLTITVSTDSPDLTADDVAAAVADAFAPEWWYLDEGEPFAVSSVKVSQASRRDSPCPGP